MGWDLLSSDLIRLMGVEGLVSEWGSWGRSSEDDVGGKLAGGACFGGGKFVVRSWAMRALIVAIIDTRAGFLELVCLR